MAYLTHFSIPALLNPMINKMADEASAILLLICSHEVWVKVTYDWSTALCLCLCLCRPPFHLLTHVLVLMRTLILMREWKPGFTLLRERKMTCSQHFPIYFALTDCAPIVTCFKSVPCLSSLTCEQALWALWRQGRKRKESLQLRLWNLNICIEKVDAKSWLAEMIVFSSRWLVEIWQLIQRGAIEEAELEFKFQRRNCKFSFLFPPRRQSVPKSLLAGYLFLWFGFFLLQYAFTEWGERQIWGANSLQKKTADAINFESVTCYLGRPRWPRFAGTSRRSRIKGKKTFRCNIVRDFLFEF